MLALVTEPYAEPVSLPELKAHVRVDADSSTEDSLIRALGIAAREWVERHLQRQLVTATYDYSVECFPTEGIIELPLPPLVSVTSVKYYDSSETLTTLDPSKYRVVTPSNGSGYVAIRPTTSVPSTYYREDAVTVRFVCGYGFQEDVPEVVKVAIKMLVAEWHRTREATVVGTIISEVPIGVERLLESYRVRGFL